MAELKTTVNNASVKDFLNFIVDGQKRKDCFEISRMMEKATKQKPKMWGPSIVRFGEYHYVYESGREGDSAFIGFSPRKQNITIYIADGFAQYQGLMKQLGKYSTGKVCLYIKRLEDVDRKVLKELITESVKAMKQGNMLHSHR
jgi:hypothetical protein